jgi:hypothetical protein
MTLLRAKAPLALLLDSECAISEKLGGALAGLRFDDRAVREEILHCAYGIWEREGHPEHRALEHWLQAEAEVLRQP